VLLKLKEGKADVGVQVCLGGAKPVSAGVSKALGDYPMLPDSANLVKFLKELEAQGQGDSFEAGQAHLILEMQRALVDRRARKPELKALPGIPVADAAKVDQLYEQTIQKLKLGLEDAIKKSKTKAVKDAAIKAGLTTSSD